MKSITLECFVKSLYKQILNREPDESGLTLCLQVLENGQKTPEEVVSDFINSVEFQLKRPIKFKGYYHNDIEWDADEETCESIFGEIFNYWNSVGIDLETVYWSVLTFSKYKGKLSEAVINEFYRSDPYGSDHPSIGSKYLSIWQSVFQDGKMPSSIVDFGAGVGRISVDLRLSFKDSHVIAVDFSQGHLETLRGNLRNPKLDIFDTVGAGNIQCLSYSTLPELKRHLSLVKPELIVSSIVLQHNPPPLMTFLVETLLSSLDKGGLAILHIPVFSSHDDYSFNLSEYLAQSMESKVDMQMHAMPANAIFEVAKRSDCQVIQFSPSHACLESFLSYDVVFQKN